MADWSDGWTDGQRKRCGSSKGTERTGAAAEPRKKGEDFRGNNGGREKRGARKWGLLGSIWRNSGMVGGLEYCLHSKRRVKRRPWLYPSHWAPRMEGMTVEVQSVGSSLCLHSRSLVASFSPSASEDPSLANGVFLKLTHPHSARQEISGHPYFPSTCFVPFRRGVPLVSLTGY